MIITTVTKTPSWTELEIVSSHHLQQYYVHVYLCKGVQYSICTCNVETYYVCSKSCYFCGGSCMLIVPAVERKRQQRMKRLGKLQEQADNYDSLVSAMDANSSLFTHSLDMWCFVVRTCSSITNTVCYSCRRGSLKKSSSKSRAWKVDSANLNRVSTIMCMYNNMYVY